MWVGNVRGGDPFSLSVTVVVSYCNHSLAWIEPYMLGFEDVKVIVVSKCGNPVKTEELPARRKVVELPNVGRCDHTMAYILSRLSTSIATSGINVTDMAYVFLKDNYNLHQMARRRSFQEMLRIASETGFGCFQEPVGGLSQWHKSSAMKTLHMTPYCGVPIVDEDGNKHCRFETNGFKSIYKNMGGWLDDMGIKLPAPYTSVCYGGMWAATAERIATVPTEVWQKLEHSLERGDNIEEGHFAERIWASLLTKPLSFREIALVRLLTTSVNVRVAPGGGGHLGALIAGYHSLKEAWKAF